MENSSRSKNSPQRQSNLEIANAMFKDAFLVKRTRFAKENPKLSASEIDKMTAEYFKNLPDEDRKIKGRTL